MTKVESLTPESMRKTRLRDLYLLESIEGAGAIFERRSGNFGNRIRRLFYGATIKVKPELKKPNNLVT